MCCDLCASPLRCTEVLTGVLTGAGRQTLGVVANVLTYWIVGIPLAKLWGGHRGSTGLWQALAVATLLQLLMLGIPVTMFDWKSEALKARQRVEEGEGLLAESVVREATASDEDPSIEHASKQEADVAGVFNNARCRSSAYPTIVGSL